MVIMMLTMVITAPMMAIGGVILALSQDAELAWVLIAVMPVMALVFGLIMRGAIPLSQAMQTKIDRLNLVLGEGPERRARDPRVRSRRASARSVRSGQSRSDATPRSP